MDGNIRGIPKHLMSVVHELYFRPQQDAFRARNLWSLSNAFTSAFKKLSPIKQFETTARLGTFLNLAEKELGNELQLNLPSKAEAELTYEDFNEDDVAEDPFEEAFDEYFDEEEEADAIDEAIARDSDYRVKQAA